MLILLFALFLEQIQIGQSGLLVLSLSSNLSARTRLRQLGLLFAQSLPAWAVLGELRGALCFET